MPSEFFLHERSDFKVLVETVADAEKINDPALVEKDYWIMHSVFGLKQLGLAFELKGGTSLSKGFGVIHRFSEDIDIRIEPFDGLQVDANPNHEKPQHVESRRQFFERLRDKIKISGITAVERDATYAQSQSLPGSYSSLMPRNFNTRTTALSKSPATTSNTHLLKKFRP